MDPNEQNSSIEEVLEQIDKWEQNISFDEFARKFGGTARPSSTEQTSNSAVIDEALFDEIKEGKHSAAAERPKSAFKRFLDGDEDENEAGDEVVFHREVEEEGDDLGREIEDFEDEQDKNAIYRDLKNIVGEMAVKSIFLFLIGIVSAFLFLASIYPVLLGGNINTVWYDICLLVVDLLCVGVSVGIFVQGLVKLIRARADTDTLLALLAVALIVFRIIGLFKRDLLAFPLVFEPFLAFGLFANVSAKKKIASNIKKNFKFISASGEKLAVTIPASCELNNSLILETGEGGDVLYAHTSGFITNYIERSYSDFGFERSYERFLFGCILSIIAGTVAVFQLAGFGAGVAFPAAALALSLPFFSKLYYAKAVEANCRKIRKNGAVLSSLQSAKELKENGLLVISEEDLLRGETVLLQGVKAMGNEQIDKLITKIAALFSQAGTPLKPLFLKMIDNSSVDLPNVTDIYFHEGLGYSCLIDSKLFLVGNRALIEQFNIPFPQELLDLKLKDGHYPVYVAHHKSPIGIFIASLEHDPNLEKALRMISKEGIHLGIASFDFLFDKKVLAKMYPDTDLDLIHFISTDLALKCKDELAPKKKTRDLITSLSGIKGLAAAMINARRILTAVNVSRVIRIIFTCLAIPLMFFIALAGYSQDTALHIWFYQLLWYLPVWFLCTFCK